MQTEFRIVFLVIAYATQAVIKRAKMLFPFTKKNNQKIVSIIAMIIGVLLMISAPIIKISASFNISGFIIGAILALIGFIYFLDIQ